jgi:hypothetical protein
MSSKLNTPEQKSPRDVLRPLFLKAQETDEFEFCCTLLRVRGIEDAYWDPLQESYQLTRQLISLIQAPLEETLNIRLVLFLYCHLTEIDDLYNIVANLLQVTDGHRYSMVPFESLPKIERKIPHGYCGNRRIDQLKALAIEREFPDVGQTFETMYVRPVRNAFYHSDYILSPDSFNIRRREGVLIGNEVRSKIELNWLFPRLELGINTAVAVIELLLEYIRSYHEDKVIPGRLALNDAWTDVQLITDPERGLTGFRSPPTPPSNTEGIAEET